jgi:hypothetical protein
VTGSVTLPAGVEMVMPGDNVAIEVELITPDSDGKGIKICDKRRRKDSRSRRNKRDFKIEKIV